MFNTASRTRNLKLARWFVPVLLLMLMLLPLAQLAGCAGPSYYMQAVSGHFSLIKNSEEIVQLLAQADIDPELARELELALEIRAFAVSRLGMPENDSYTRFVDTGREAVTWNVVAAPEFSLAPKKWCFLVSGCVPYRGYFKHDSAVQFSDSLARKGYDVTVSPAVAYSTLGWFDDPLLNTMLNYNDEQLAAFIFHELAHQQLYIKGDTAFNEAYASFIEETGVRLWLASSGMNDRLPDWLQLQRASMQFNRLLQEARSMLEKEYASNHPEAVMKENKSAIFAGLREAYDELVATQWNGRSIYASWFERELNNAQLALISSYQGGACAFESLYQSADSNMMQFQALARDRAKLSKEQRSAWLNQPCEVIASGPEL